MRSLLLFGNISAPPYCNNLYPPVRAFQKAFRTRIVEPFRYAGFTGTGGARPAPIPEDAVIESSDPPPDVVVCLGGALHLTDRGRRSFPRDTALAGFALSDPYGLAASIAIAPSFDLFYTQDPQTLPDYALRRIPARRCDPATDPELYFPERGATPDCDILYYGKWTPYRDGLLASLAARFRVRLHAYAGETRWSIPVLPPLDTPEALRAGLNRCRLALETALLDDAQGSYRGKFRLTPRVFFAASCGVPTLVESFPALSEYFEPNVEIAAFTPADGLVERAAALLGDEAARTAMGRRARQRALREHTWDRRIESFVLDVEAWKRAPGPRPGR
ncbi:MAG TPA: glycosyltransferase [Thermoanaerobaculia bacterium]|nr:glycosyltransferase [Thermoanaerobaculia bacterium]